MSEEKETLTLEQRLENLIRQQNEANIIATKCQGSIELLQALIEERDKDLNEKEK